MTLIVLAMYTVVCPSVAQLAARNRPDVLLAHRVNPGKCAKFPVTRHPYCDFLLFSARLGHRIEQPYGLCLRSGTRPPGKSFGTLCADLLAGGLAALRAACWFALVARGMLVASR